MKLITGLIFIILFLFQLNNSCYSQDNRWVYVTSSIDGHNVFIDSTTVICDLQECIIVWVKTEYTTNSVKSKNGKIFDYRMENYKYYEGKRKYTLLTYTNYYTDGSIYNKEHFNESGTVVPDTVGEDIYNYVIENYSCR